MSYVQKCRLSFLGIDDELKNDSSSVYSTPISSSLFPIPPPVAVGTAPIYENQRYGVQAVAFTQKINTKRFNFSLNGA